MTNRDLTLSAEEVQRRLGYVGFTQEDASRIQPLRSLIEANVDRLTSAFFDHLAAFPETRPLFGNHAALDLAKTLKREHLIAMGSGPYDVRYAEQRVRLGRHYSNVGLDLRVFLGAFHRLIRGVGELVYALVKADPFETFMSFEKLAFFDLALIVDALIFERERTILQQQDAIRELSTPVLQLRDRLLMLPIIGLIDTHRARLLTENLLGAIRTNRARVVVMDVTGVAAVDTKVANHLLQTVAACRLMGAEVIVTGLSAEVSQTLVALGVNLTGLKTVGDLQGGIEDAERLLGLRVVSASQ
jgi:rsbT co-antagonist protein RsbR